MTTHSISGNKVEKIPEDGTAKHVWLWEPSVNNGGVLTADGVENIARHQYVPGHYTVIDNFLNPVWLFLTENLLPMWLAPNAVTTLGFLHCLVSYCVLWWYSPNFDQCVPDWTLMLSGYCIIVYYTLDCMDGKQARRTGSSSPLGQLFDHGVDCVCNLAFCANIFGLVMIGSGWCLMIQFTLQFTFYMAQWEEYHTHVLQHSVGGVFGVTEVNYGLALFTLLNAFLDRKALWRLPINYFLPFLPDNNIHLGHASLIGTLIMFSLLIIGSLKRVSAHPNVRNNRMTAFGQLITPASIGIALVFLPQSVLENQTRYVSLAMGLLFSLLTKKIIVFSMAKMTFATIQLEAIPLLLVTFFIQRNNADDATTFDQRILQLLCLWYMFRLHKWAWLAVNQICRRLDIYCFTIKHPKKS